MTTHKHPALGGLTVFERGWLSSNNLLLWDGEGDGDGKGDSSATLIDSGHVTHAAMTVSLVQRALASAPQPTRLARVINTHLHSDHCGGNAALQRAFGAEVWVPPGHHAAAAAWDEDALTYRDTGQLCERYTPQQVLQPGTPLPAGGRRWDVLAAPGHDSHSVILFDATNGLLVSADALWENGFGVVFPELDGEAAFDDVAAVLDLVERLDPRAVVPGHGAPFTDVAGALQRARSRLAAFRGEPARHGRHAAKVLLKYHLMEVHEQPLHALIGWITGTPLLRRLHATLGGAALHDWAQALVADLLAAGALRLEDGRVKDA
jgi:glyoxylase-like metal-dependent hydrolase (beta-lactamase superfamily II)